MFDVMIWLQVFPLSYVLYYLFGLCLEVLYVLRVDIVCFFFTSGRILSHPSSHLFFVLQHMSFRRLCIITVWCVIVNRNAFLGYTFAFAAKWVMFSISKLKFISIETGSNFSWDAIDSQLVIMCEFRMLFSLLK
jgi:hypothetical protein